MARELAESTLKRLSSALDEERERLSAIIAEMEQEREEVRLSESSSERSPDPNTAEGGSMAFEFEKELSVARNAEDLLAKVEHARKRINEGRYGVCELCGTDIPVARLEALPHASQCVTCAAKR